MDAVGNIIILNDIYIYIYIYIYIDLFYNNKTQCDNNKCYNYYKKIIEENCDRSKLDKKRFKAKSERQLVMATGNVFRASIDLEKKLFAILFVRQKGFKRQ